MKLISLNTWGAFQGQLFFEFLQKEKIDTDVFCFQEIFSAGLGAPEIHAGYNMFEYEKLVRLLPEYESFFAAKSYGYPDDSPDRVSWPVNFGTAVFARRNLKIQSSAAKILGNALVGDAPPIEGQILAQILSFEITGKLLHIINIHGMSRPGSKLDTPERLAQSSRLIEIIKVLPTGNIILCGDFNLMPETQSVKLLEGAGLKNLIKEFNITNTRNEISWNRYHNRQYFADFTFVSPGVTVKKFEVPYNLVSDHLPMVLDFEV